MKNIILLHKLSTKINKKFHHEIISVIQKNYVIQKKIEFSAIKYWIGIRNFLYRKMEFIRWLTVADDKHYQDD